MNIHFDFCVIGAGLAGMHTALELGNRGASVCMIDPNGIAGGASGTPVGLANPATGRYASRSWNAEESLEHLTNSLLKSQEYSETSFFKQTGVLRPAVDEKIASRMRTNFEEDEWEHDSIEWLDESEIKSFHPGITCVKGGVWVPKGLTVHIPKYLMALESRMKRLNVTFIFNSPYEINNNLPWEFKFRSGQKASAQTCIFTSGIWTTHHELWSHLKMHAVKGQTLVLQTQSPIPFEHAVSALGYFSKMDENTLIYGSTYEHRFEHDNPDQAGEEYMLTRFERVLPAQVGQSKVVSSWAGIRASTPDRKPYVGAHPKIENCFTFTGLGSKGLLYSSIGAKILVDHIFEQTEIPTEIEINRFQ